jgi:hypothetical protein
MDAGDIVDGEWWEPRAEPETAVPEAIRARARLAQAVALRDMANSWQRQGRVVSQPAPKLVLVASSSKPVSATWLASCGGSRSERARAAESLAINDFISRPLRPHPPLRSI